MRKYFYTNGVEKFGPFSIEELKNQKLTRETKIWYFGLKDWTILSDIEELKPLVNSIPPTLPTSPKSEDKIITETIITKKQNTKTINKKSFKLNKWVIVSIIGIITFFDVYIVAKNIQKNNLYNEISQSSYVIENINFDFYVDKFYRDISNYGIFPKRPKTKIIRFANFEHFNNATHIHGISFGKDNDDLIEIYINPYTWEKFNKPMRYYIMYHELAHDVLNLDDLSATPENEGKLMYPELENYNEKTMDDFIESSHELFEEYTKK
jgi:hypothetical protein